jgi:hypothetical protein
MDSSTHAQILPFTGRSMRNRKLGRVSRIRERLIAVATEEKTMKAALENYHDRIQWVLDHIDRNLDDDLDLDLEAMSNVAALSK